MTDENGNEVVLRRVVSRTGAPAWVFHRKDKVCQTIQQFADSSMNRTIMFAYCSSVKRVKARTFVTLEFKDTSISFFNVESRARRQNEPQTYVHWKTGETKKCSYWIRNDIEQMIVGNVYQLILYKNNELLQSNYQIEISKLWEQKHS